VGPEVSTSRSPKYQKILREHPNDANERAAYARVLAWSGRAEESLVQFRLAAGKDSTDFETRIGYARALSWAGDLPGASMEYERILDRKPAYGDAWLGIATVARWRGSPTASDRFVAMAETRGADKEGVEEEKNAIRVANAHRWEAAGRRPMNGSTSRDCPITPSRARGRGSRAARRGEPAGSPDATPSSRSSR